MPGRNAHGWRHALVVTWQHRWFILALLIVLIAGTWYAARLYFGPSVVVDQVVRGNLVQTVVASGHVESRFRVDIGSQITGSVEEVLVDEGQQVQKGQPLIALESRELKAAVVQAESAVAQAEARLRQLRELTLPAARESLTQAKITLLNAQQTYDRTSDLAAKGAATRVALDEAQKNLDIARTLARTAELQVFTNSPGGSDYVLAETQLNQAKANLETAQSRLGYATVVAPRDGTLISRKVEKGAVVQPGKSLFVLAPAGSTQLVIQVDEKNLGLIKLGQAALASADAYPDRTFSGARQLHQSGCRHHAGLGRSQADGARPSRLSAPGHDRVRGHRGRAPSGRAHSAPSRHLRSGDRDALGHDPSEGKSREAPRQARDPGEHPRRTS